MKHLFIRKRACILLALILLFSLTSCADAPKEPTAAKPASTVRQTEAVPSETLPVEPEPRTGLKTVTGVVFSANDSYIGLFAREGEGAVLLLRWNEEAGRYEYRVVFADPATAVSTGEVLLDEFDPLLFPTGLSVSDTEIVLTDENQERCAVFDRTGAFLCFRDWPVTEKEHLGWQNRLLGDATFWKETEFATFSDIFSTELGRAVAFYDEADRVHVLHRDYESVAVSLGHRLLLLRYPETAGTLEYAIADLDADLELDRVGFTRESEDDPWVNPCGAAMTEDWVLLVTQHDSNNEAYLNISFWYPGQDDVRPLDAQTMTEDWLRQQIDGLKAELEAEGMTFHLDEAPAPEQTPTTGLNATQSVCDTGASLFGQYRILSGLKAFEDTLPAGFIRELFDDMPGDGWERDSLHVYVVRNIPGDAAAFANGWGESMSVCFSTEEYSASQIPHEFMHLIDFRLTQYLWTEGRDLETEWQALSPAYAYNDDLTPEQEQTLDGCFVSWYARTNTLEDRAETFESLFDSSEPVAEAWWYAENAGVRAKARYLVREIREAFPSVQAVDAACWERLPEEE